MENNVSPKRNMPVRLFVGSVLMGALLVLIGAVWKVPDTYTIERIAFPSAPDSGEPFLAPAYDGGVLASWVEQLEDGSHRLQFARLKDTRTGWSGASTIASGDNWFVNWADVPSIASGPGGRVAAHWLERLGDGRYAYGVRISVSEDDGVTWSQPVWLHDDESPTEHGFVSLSFAQDGSLYAVWLDGRAMALSGGAMAIMGRRMGPDGRFGEEELIDGRTCECCPTALARSGDGSVLAAFRDRSEEEFRSITVARRTPSGWGEEPWTSDDGWQISACPVNGPALASVGERTAVAWFTAPEDEPAVRVAFSGDHGASFSAPLALHGARPIGRVGLVAIDDERVAVTWIESASPPSAQAQAQEQAPAHSAGIKLRIVHSDGTLAPAQTVASTASSRSAGYPRVASTGNQLVFLWTETGDPNRVVSAIGLAQN